MGKRLVRKTGTRRLSPAISLEYFRGLSSELFEAIRFFFEENCGPREFLSVLDLVKDDNLQQSKLLVFLENAVFLDKVVKVVAPSTAIKILQHPVLVKYLKSTTRNIEDVGMIFDVLDFSKMKESKEAHKLLSQVLSREASHYEGRVLENFFENQCLKTIPLAIRNQLIEKTAWKISDANANDELEMQNIRKAILENMGPSCLNHFNKYMLIRTIHQS